jgi:hypothetical protein
MYNICYNNCRIDSVWRKIMRWWKRQTSSTLEHHTHPLFLFSTSKECIYNLIVTLSLLDMRHICVVSVLDLFDVPHAAERGHHNLILSFIKSAAYEQHLYLILCNSLLIFQSFNESFVSNSERAFIASYTVRSSDASSRLVATSSGKSSILVAWL